ncbi:MAG: pyridine nucleotide-disulfide oxidoreductase, partial [Kiritimatiellae bacterium]|nr:pyridine nucleotide-disulfide oxidoreductase [Kiritimatiellia bacterium]
MNNQKQRRARGARPTAVALALFTCAALATQAEVICLESEQFADRGGWAVDSQFIDQMGSTFLLAHGMGKPVADAVTSFDCREAGTYHVWARTRNWTAPWSEHAAGTFTIKVNGKELPNVLGRGTGDWQWQKAGEVKLAKGKTAVSLHDLTGFDGRCDMVCLSPVDGKPVMPV